MWPPMLAVGQSGSRAQNETGVSVALRYAGLRNSVMRGFIDAFRHPRPTFRAAAPSVGMGPPARNGNTGGVRGDSCSAIG